MIESQAATRPDDITDEMLAGIDQVIADHTSKGGALIPVLQKSQGVCGYLPVFVQEYIADKLGLPGSSVYGVVTFYSFFTMVPRGRHVIRVCMGTACFVKGSNETLTRLRHNLSVEIGETTEDRRFTLEAVRCLGACGLAPITVIDEDTHRGFSSNKVDEIISRYQ